MARIVSIQALRGVAATLVAGFHLCAAAQSEGFDPKFFALFSGGDVGVDIFFVISGFIIYYVSSNRPQMTGKDFLESRFWRIYPPYWVVLTLNVVLAYALLIVLNDAGKTPDVTTLVLSYLLVPYPDFVIVIAWTLALEILFYIVFALTFFTGGRRVFFGAMVVWVLATQAFAYGVSNKPVWLLLPLHSAVLEFLYGAVIAHVFLTKTTRWHVPAFAFGCVWIALITTREFGVTPNLGREFYAGIPAAFLIYGAIGLNWRANERLETWGESSYILYIVHLLFFSVAGRAVETAFGFNVYGSTTAMLMLLLAVCATAYVATLYLERPYQNWYRARFAKKS